MMFSSIMHSETSKFFDIILERLKFIYSEKATFCEIFTLLLTGTTQDKNKVKISQNFVAFSEYMNFNSQFSLIFRRDILIIVSRQFLNILAVLKYIITCYHKCLKNRQIYVAIPLILFQHFSNLEIITCHHKCLKKTRQIPVAIPLILSQL